MTNLAKKTSNMQLFARILMFFCMIGAAIATDFQQLATLAQQRYGSEAKASVIELEALLNQLQTANEQEKLNRINHFFNSKINFVSDSKNWGQKDYWATPLESIGTAKGDCEDYSIAKYVFLRALGIPNNRLKLTYVRAKIGGPHSKIVQAHMVLSYYVTPTDEPMILDNLISEIHKSSRRIDLTPIFSFNSEGMWAGASSKKRGSSLKSLSRWKKVLIRIKQDGID